MSQRYKKKDYEQARQRARSVTPQQREWLAWVSTPEGLDQWNALVREGAAPSPPRVVGPAPEPRGRYEERQVDGKRRLVWVTD